MQRSNGEIVASDLGYGEVAGVEPKLEQASVLEATADRVEAKSEPLPATLNAFHVGHKKL
jgi:hypothetical protein